MFGTDANRTIDCYLLVANKIAIIAILIMVILLYNWWQLIVLILFTLILSSLVKTAKQKCMKLNSNYKNFSRTVKCQWCKLYKQKAINLCFIPHSPPPSLYLFFSRATAPRRCQRKRWWRSTQRWQADLPMAHVGVTSAAIVVSSSLPTLYEQIYSPISSQRC